MAEKKPTTREIIEGIRGEPIPDGWDPASGGAYTREFWAPDAATANRWNRAFEKAWEILCCPHCGSPEHDLCVDEDHRAT